MTDFNDSLNGSPRLNEMIEGYHDGRESDRTELHKGHNYSVAYVHGWLNGRDDRLGKPRERAAVLKARASMILGEEV